MCQYPLAMSLPRYLMSQGSLPDPKGLSLLSKKKTELHQQVTMVFGKGCYLISLIHSVTKIKHGKQLEDNILLVKYFRSTIVIMSTAHLYTNMCIVAILYRSCFARCASVCECFYSFWINNLAFCVIGHNLGL